MEFIGSIKDVCQAREVNGKYYRDIVLAQMNYTNGYEVCVCFTISDEKVYFNGQRDYKLQDMHNAGLLNVGSMLKVMYNLSATKSQDGKWFNSARCWGINTLDYGRQQKPSVQSEPQPQQAATQTTPPPANDNVPF